MEQPGELQPGANSDGEDAASSTLQVLFGARMLVGMIVAGSRDEIQRFVKSLWKIVPKMERAGEAASATGDEQNPCAAVFFQYFCHSRFTAFLQLNRSCCTYTALTFWREPRWRLLMGQFFN